MADKPDNNSDLDDALEKIVGTRPQRMTISGVRHADGEPAGIMRARVSILESGAALISHDLSDEMPARWQIEEFSKTQSFHKNVDAVGLIAYCASVMGARFSQLDAWTPTHEMHLRLSKRGRVMFSHKRLKEADRTPSKADTGAVDRAVRVGNDNEDEFDVEFVDAKRAKAAANAEHEKKRLLPEGTVVPALVDLGIFTADGQVVSSMYDKYKQINRFLEIVDDALANFKGEELVALDYGCGKSYLTFILYYYLTEIRGLKVNMTGLDLKEDVIEQCNETAKKYGYDGLHFEVGDVAGYDPGLDRIDLMVTLHACDTATDYALASAIAWNAGVILSVPCCQHELNKQIRTRRLYGLTRYGIIKERTAALLTDAIRANLLEACGYRTQVLEFVDFAHAPKNLLIRAVKVNRPERVAVNTQATMVTEVERLMNEFAVEPTLYRILKSFGEI